VLEAAAMASWRARSAAAWTSSSAAFRASSARRSASRRIRSSSSRRRSSARLLLGFVAEPLDELLDPFGGLAANLLGALHHAPVDVGLDLGDPLPGERLELVRVRLGLCRTVLGLAGALLGGLDPVLGLAFGGLTGLLGESFGHLLEVAGAGGEPFLTLGRDLGERLVAGLPFLLQRSLEPLQVRLDLGLGLALFGVPLLEFLHPLFRLEPRLAGGLDLLARLGAQLPERLAGLRLDLLAGLRHLAGGLCLGGLDALVGGGGTGVRGLGLLLRLAGLGERLAGSLEGLQFRLAGRDLGLAGLRLARRQLLGERLDARRQPGRGLPDLAQLGRQPVAGGLILRRSWG
jgi:hypothetical protein